MPQELIKKMYYVPNKEARINAVYVASEETFMTVYV